MKCDYCDKEAVKNYQKVWIIWDILGEDDYSNDYKLMSLQEPTGRNNRHLCKKHVKAFEKGEI